MWSLLQQSRCRLIAGAVALALVFATGPVAAQKALRVATWNIETVGAAGSTQYDAAIAVLRRLGADVVALAEVASTEDVANFQQLAIALGYAHTTVAPAGPFGNLRGAFMSIYPVRNSVAWNAAALSADPAANDITRYILDLEIDVTGQGAPVRLISTHWKSGTTDTDEFRRAIESRRLRRVADDALARSMPFVVMGDVNEDVGDGAQFPALFTVAPADLPTGFHVGADVLGLMNGGGLANDPFALITARAPMIEARQLDGSDATRPPSGRRLDYLFAAPTIRVAAAQVYDCADEALPAGMPLNGQPLDASICALASDHLPVLADLVVPTPGATLRTLTVTRAGSGSGRITSSPAGIDCGADCVEQYADAAVITLNALADAGSTFTGWTGVCSGTGSCVLSLTADTTIGATFAASPPTIRFGAATVTVSEGAGTVAIPVTRSSSVGTAAVNYATVDGSAVAGQDYTATTGTLSLAAGVTMANIVVSITDDRLAELDETFTVALSGPSASAVLGLPSTATVTIRDNGDRSGPLRTALLALIKAIRAGLGIPP